MLQDGGSLDDEAAATAAARGLDATGLSDDPRLTTGEAGTIPPLVGLWMPNALFLATGLWGLRLAAHERTPAIVSLFSHSRLILRRKRASA